jgi:hypothetical protein
MKAVQTSVKLLWGNLSMQMGGIDRRIPNSAKGLLERRLVIKVSQMF